MRTSLSSNKFNSNFWGLNINQIDHKKTVKYKKFALNNVFEIKTKSVCFGSLIDHQNSILELDLNKNMLTIVFKGEL